jgi:hypothetical protein
MPIRERTNALRRRSPPAAEPAIGEGPEDLLGVEVVAALVDQVQDFVESGGEKCTNNGIVTRIEGVSSMSSMSTKCDVTSTPSASR